MEKILIKIYRLLTKIKKSNQWFQNLIDSNSDSNTQYWNWNLNKRKNKWLTENKSKLTKIDHWLKIIFMSKTLPTFQVWIIWCIPNHLKQFTQNS